MILRNSDGELYAETPTYTIEKSWIPFRSVKPYAGEYTPVRSVMPYPGNYTPARTVKGFDMVRILPGGGNMPSMPQQAGAIVGFAGVKKPAHEAGGCAACAASGPSLTTLLILGGLGYGAYKLYQRHQGKKG